MEEDRGLARKSRPQSMTEFTSAGVSLIVMDLLGLYDDATEN